MPQGTLGRYFSNTYTTPATNGYDLISRVESDLGETNIVAKKLTYIATGSYMVNVNSSASYSKLWQDADGYWKLSLDGYDCAVSSFKIGDASASGIFLAIIY